ncbi:helix-turn-helix transcriptional regulator [Rhizobium sp. Rhizsp42]|uniref:helix-turn-helix transcriptional regulator n=1 Tax=Rhizobium sp. Rhizsp42 TaxID=3243034 RepID=UPI0039B0CF3F
MRTGDFTKSGFVTHGTASVLPIAGPDILLPHHAGDELRRIVKSRSLEREKMGFSVGLTGCDTNAQRYALIVSRADRGPTCDLVPIAFGFLEIVHLFASARGMTSPNKLSNREKECLAWAAAGKSSIETGLILKLSPHTVNGHVKSAVRKLDVVNRMQAIAKACRLRII